MGLPCRCWALAAAERCLQWEPTWRLNGVHSN